MNKKYLLFFLNFIILTCVACKNKELSKIDTTLENNNIKVENRTSIVDNKDVEKSRINIESNKSIEKNLQNKIKKEEIKISSDEKIVTEFYNIESDINRNIIINSNSLLDKIGDKVAIMIGFLFYEEEIKGVKFDDLTNSTKEKILKIYYSIDSKVESKIPNYKENIKNKSVVISKYIKDKYTNVREKTSNYMEEKMGEKKYQQYQTKKEELKQDIKQGIDSSVSDIKNVKDIYKEKIDEWYEKKKSN